MEMKSRSQIRRVRSQIECKHDLAVSADGHCPLCLLKRIEELEDKLRRHDMSKYEMVNKQYLKQIEELAMNNNHKQFLKQINKLSIMVNKIRAKLKSDNDNPCDYCKQIGFFPDWCDLRQCWCSEKIDELEED